PDVRIFPLVADPTVSVTPDGTTQGLKPVSLHDALPIYEAFAVAGIADRRGCKDMHLPYLHEAGHEREALDRGQRPLNVLLCQLADRKSTRLNSSHVKISYAVFCLKKKHQPGQRHCPSPD